MKPLGSFTLVFHHDDRYYLRVDATHEWYLTDLAKIEYHRIALERPFTLDEVGGFYLELEDQSTVAISRLELASARGGSGTSRHRTPSRSATTKRRRRKRKSGCGAGASRVLARPSSSV